MKYKSLLGWMVFGLALWGQAAAGEAPCPGPCGQSGNPWCCMRHYLTGCPDVYCGKPFPLIHSLEYCGPCDEYLCKPQPRIWYLRPCGPDNYCSKPCPDLCRPLCNDFYICNEGCCRGQTAPAPAPVAEMPWQAPVQAGKVEYSGSPPSPYRARMPASAAK